MVIAGGMECPEQPLVQGKRAALLDGASAKAEVSLALAATVGHGLGVRNVAHSVEAAAMRAEAITVRPAFGLVPLCRRLFVREPLEEFNSTETAHALSTCQADRIV